MCSSDLPVAELWRGRLLQRVERNARRAPVHMTSELVDLGLPEIRDDGESPGGVAAMVLDAELFRLGDDHLERYPREIRAVTKDDVVAIASELLPIDRYALAIAGPELPKPA